MGKRIFWIFILTVAATTAMAVMYIQSESFARIAKEEIQKAVARDFGLELNFDRLRIGVLPPSLSMVNVDVKVRSPSNPLNLATDTVIRAESIGFSFRMIQAFSRGISVNKVFFNNGEIRLLVPKGKSGGKEEKLSEIVHAPIHIPLTEGFTASIRQLEFRNTRLNLSFRERERLSRISIESIVYLAITPAKDGTNLVSNFENIDLDLAGLNEKLKVLKLNADISRDLIDLSTLDAQRKEVALHAAGKILGSIDRLEDSRPDIDLILRGPLSELSDFESSLKGIQGEVLADVKVVGKVKAPALQGKLEIANFSHSLWSIDKVMLAGSFGSGFLTVDSFLAERNGGKLSLKNKLEIPIPFQPEPAAVQVKLENARFEDFAGDIRKSVNNLRMGLNGTLDLRLEFAKREKGTELASIAIKPDLAVNELELNNQAFGKSRPYKRIFRLRPFRLTGSLGWQGGEVRVNEGLIAFESGTVSARGTVSDARGFDLKGSSEFVNLGEEVGDISGIPLTGNGAIAVHVHGPGDNVILDFDLNQDNVRFVNFNFGSVEGKVTYDEKKSYIFIPGINGKKSGSAYSVKGSVNVGDGDDLELDATFKESDPNDLFAIFATQLEKITWIPHGMGGTVAGHARVSGGYSGGLDSLNIDGTLNGQNLVYSGEIVQELDLSARLAQGKLKARVLKGRKYETPFTGEIEYALNGEMKYFLDAPKAKLRSLDFFSNSGIPVDGLFSFHSEGKGKWETLDSTTSFEMKNAFVRTRPLPPANFALKTSPGSTRFTGNLGTDLTAAVNISHDPKGLSDSSFRFSNGDFSFLLCAINKRNCADPRLALNIDGEFHSTWQGDNWRAMNGGGKISEVELSRSSFSLRSAEEIKITAASGMIEAEKVQLAGEQSRINLRLKGKADGSSIDTQVQGDSSLRLLEFVSPLIEEARGRMGISLGLSGSVSDAHFKGNVDIQDGFLRVGGLDAPADALNGRIRFMDSRISIENLNGNMGGGTVQASGSIDLFLNKAPKFDIDLFLANNRVKFVPVNFAEISDGKLSLTGDKPPYLFGGTVRVRRVMMRNNFDMASGKRGAKSARYLPEKLGGAKSFYEIRIRAIAENGVVVENNLLDAEFRGELTLLNNFESPQIVARAELVRGKLLFRNTAFTLDHAYIRAPNPEYFNPQFSVGGIASVDNYRISIHASGTIEKPKITLSSYPALPQEDIVSLLAFGYRGEDARKVNQNDSTAITYSEVGSILLEQLQLSQNLQSKGLRVTVVPSLNDNEANIIRPNSAQTASPKVYLQTQIMKNLEAAFGGSVGSSQGQSLDAKLEYRLGRKASVSAVYEQSPAGLDATETKNSYGADLKFRWGFK